MKFHAELSWLYYSGLCRYDTALPVHDTAGHLRLPHVTEPTHIFLCSFFYIVLADDSCKTIKCWSCPRKIKVRLSKFVSGKIEGLLSVLQHTKRLGVFLHLLSSGSCPC